MLIHIHAWLIVCQWHPFKNINAVYAFNLCMKRSCFIILGILDFVFHCYKGNTKPTDVSISVMFSNISSIKSLMLLILRYCSFLITIPNIGLMKYIKKTLWHWLLYYVIARDGAALCGVLFAVYNLILTTDDEMGVFSLVRLL